MILAGDVGGTKTILGLFTRVGGKLKVVREESFASRDYPSLDAIVRQFLARGRQRIHGCAVGVAGPILDSRSQVVNLPWVVDAGRLSAKLGAGSVHLLNDLEATAWGVSELSPRKLVSLTPGVRRRPGAAVLIAAGTGLGMALMAWDGNRHIPCPSEGGHQGFGPRNDLEIALLRFLRRRHGRVSIERVVAGPGISAIYQFLIENGWGQQTPAGTGLRPNRAADPNAAIVSAALAREDPVAEKTLDMFISLYGSVAGDLALVARATGGVYVGGGIAPRILPRLRSGDFVRAFRSKGRLGSLMERIPVHVILEPRTALLGAAVCAAQRIAPRARPSAGRGRRKR